MELLCNHELAFLVLALLLFCLKEDKGLLEIIFGLGFLTD